MAGRDAPSVPNRRLASANRDRRRRPGGVGVSLRSRRDRSRSASSGACHGYGADRRQAVSPVPRAGPAGAAQDAASGSATPVVRLRDPGANPNRISSPPPAPVRKDRRLPGSAVLAAQSASEVSDETRYGRTRPACACAPCAHQALPPPDTRVPTDELAGLPQLVIEGLKGQDARALLETVLTGPGGRSGHAASVVVTVRVWSPKLAMRSSRPPSASM